MSIRIMTWVWENGPCNVTQRMVLLALADFSNDDGECYPSIRRLASKACLSERGVQKVIRVLEADEWLQIKTGNGRHGCNQYQIATSPPAHRVSRPVPKTVNRVHPEPRAPRTACTPNEGTETPNMVQGERGSGRTRVQETLNGGSPEPSRTVITTAQQQSPAREAEIPPRVRLLAAMGLGPDGIAGPSRFLGTQSDMAEMEKWSALGLGIEQICAVIAETCARYRAADPAWMPSRFRFFSGPIADLVQAKARPLPASKTPPRVSTPDMCEKMRRWKSIADKNPETGMSPQTASTGERP